MKLGTVTKKNSSGAAVDCFNAALDEFNIKSVTGDRNSYLHRLIFYDI